MCVCVCVRLTTSALSAITGPATVPVVGVEHGDVATLVLQIHVLLQLLQRFVHTHVGVGELCTGRRERDNTFSRNEASSAIIRKTKTHNSQPWTRLKIVVVRSAVLYKNYKKLFFQRFSILKAGACYSSQRKGFQRIQLPVMMFDKLNPQSHQHWIVHHHSHTAQPWQEYLK